MMRKVGRVALSKGTYEMKLAKKMTKDQIIGALPNLDVEDLRAIQALVKGLLNEAPKAPEGGASPEAWLYEALQAVFSLPYPIAATLKAQHTGPFLAFVGAVFPYSENRVPTVGSMRMLLELIKSDLEAKQVPVTIHTVTNNLPRIAEIFDSAFPNYRDSGLVKLVIPRSLK